MAKAEKISLQEVVEDIKRLAEVLDKDPSEITRGDYFGNGGDYTFNDIKKLGGLAGIIKDAFPQEKDLGQSRGIKQRSAYVGKLERETGDWYYFEERLKGAFCDALQKFPITVNKRRPVPSPRVANKVYERTNNVLISDTHFGLHIDPLEVEGSHYNWTIAARRFGYLIDAIAKFKLDHRDDCGELILNFAGDICHGSLHPEDSNVDLLSFQIVGATRFIVAGIDYLLDFYPKIRVPITTDNHMRMLNHVKGKSRATSQKYDSFVSIMFEGVQQAFRNEPRVEFILPKTPYTLYKVYGRTHLITHGDTYISLGYPGRSLDIGKITAQIDSLNATMVTENKVQVLMSGHVHHGVFSELQNGVQLFINPSMCGVDPFAQAIGVRASNPAQWMFESVREYAVGDQRLVRVSEADGDPNFESIIPAFDYDFALRRT